MGGSLTAKIVETYFAQLLRLFLSGVATIVIARALGPAGRGSYAVAMAIGALGVQLGNIGLHSSNAYNVARDPSLVRVLLSNSLASSVCLGSAISAAIWLVCRLWPAIAPVEGRLLFIALLSIPVALAYLLVQNLLLGLHLTRWYNVTDIINRAACLAVVLVMIAARWSSASSFVLASLLVTFLCLIPPAAVLNDNHFSVLRPSAMLFRSSIGISIKAYIICFLGYLLLRLDLFMVQRMSGLEQAGWYSIATTLADYLMLLPTVVAAIVFPKLSAMRDMREKARLTARASFATAALMLPLVVGSGILIKIVIRVLFGTAFLPASTAFLVLIPGIFFLGIEMVLVQFLNSEGFPGSVVGAWVCAVVLNILLNLYLIPRFGIAGASLASSICYMLMFIQISIIVLRTIHHSAEPVLP